MKRNNQVIWGVLLIGAGLLWGLNSLGFTRLTLFFDGWWTLFIIIPCLVGILNRQDVPGNIFGLAVGCILLLCCRNILDFDILWKLAFPALVILFGVKMIFGNLLDRNGAEAMKRIESSAGPATYGTAVFSGERLNFSGEVFHGAELNAVFGGVECDLRNALIDQDCVIQASAIFGGIDVFAPNNVNVKIISNSIFGGTSNKAANYHNDAAPTIYIRATCLFGGVEVK